MIIRNYLKNPFKYTVLSLSAHGLLNRLSDRAYLKLIYRAHMGKRLDLRTPKTFNEKLQWLKLYDRNPLYTAMVDKYEAKRYVADRIGEEKVIPTLGVWERFEEIDFDALPDKFVLKCTHDSGGLSVCSDKSRFDRHKAAQKIRASLARCYYLRAREWPYKNVKPRIIAEPFMEDENQTTDLTDYKFYCFNGKPAFLYVSTGMTDHKKAKMRFLTLDWQFAPFGRTDYLRFEQLPPKPSAFEEMIRTAAQLSKDIPFVRVDLYEIGSRMYFSELTFSPCGGMMPFDPPEWDEKIGGLLTLPSRNQYSL